VALLSPGDQFPALTVALVGGGTLQLPDALTGTASSIANPSSWNAAARSPDSDVVNTGRDTVRLPAAGLDVRSPEAARSAGEPGGVGPTREPN
jgi:hypothetical protein